MTINQLREVHQRQPFLPFTLQLADGNEVEVPHPELLLINPQNPRTVVVALPDGVFKIVDLLLVASIEFGNGKAPRKRRR